MRGDWLCPCILFIGGAIWLATSAYFATTNWKTVLQVRREWVGATCVLRDTLIRPCSVLGATEEVVARCKVNLLFAPSYRTEGGRIVRGTNNNSVAVRNPGANRGCVFENCADARAWAERRFPEGTREVPCWALRASSGTPELNIDHPAAGSRRDSIIFTVCAAVAGLLVMSMVFVMVGLVVRDCKERL